MIIEITGGAAAKQVQIVTTNEARAFGKNELNIQWAGDFLSIQENSKPHAILYISKYDEVTVTGQPIFASAALLYAYLIANEYFFSVATGGGGVAVAMDYLTPLANYHELSWTNTNLSTGTITLYSLPAGTAVNTTNRWDGTDWVENTILHSDGTNVELGAGTLLPATTLSNTIFNNGGGNTVAGLTGYGNYFAAQNAGITGGIHAGNIAFFNGDTITGNLTNTFHSGAFNSISGGNGGLFSIGAFNTIANTYVGAIIGQNHNVQNADNIFVAACNGVTLNNLDNCAVFGMQNPYTVDQSYALHCENLVVNSGLRIRPQTDASVTVTVSREQAIVNCTNAGNTTVNLPATPNNGEIHYIKHNIGVGNTLTINAGAGKTIDGLASYVTVVSKSCTQIVYNLATTDWIII